MYNTNNSHEERPDTVVQTLKHSDIAQAFRYNLSSPGALRYLVESGHDLQEIAMRVRIPRKRTEAYQRIVAIAHVNAKALEFNDTAGRAELLMVATLGVSEDGQGRQELVEAAIGEFRKRSHGGGGFGGWLRDRAAPKENTDGSPR